MYEKRSERLERIDTGDYTPEEYERFLVEIRKVNKYAGDARALRRTAVESMQHSKAAELRILDVGAGSGELLRQFAKYARSQENQATLCGLELNERSARSILEESRSFPEIVSVQADGLKMPFADRSFDIVISSLFTHHLTDSQLIAILREMARVSRGEVFVIDLHRHPMALLAYKAFCTVFRISQLVRQDGSLSILRAFKPSELAGYAEQAGLRDYKVERSFPFRLVLRFSAPHPR